MRIAVIPARGGSKRIPRKNIRSFCGRPMITWSITIAKESNLFDRIMVSTDDPEISRVAVAHGADAPFVRPPELSDDYATTTDVIAHAVRWTVKEGWALRSVCCIYPTAPFITAHDLARGLEVLEAGTWDYTFAATEYPAPIFRSFKTHRDGGVEMFFPEHFSTRSQDLPMAMHDAGQFYWGRPAAWIDGRPIFSTHSTPIVIPRWRVQDIDNEDDWTRAEMLAPIVMGRTP